MCNVTESEDYSKISMRINVRKNNWTANAGEAPQVVLRGRTQIEKDDVLGNEGKTFVLYKAN